MKSNKRNILNKFSIKVQLFVASICVVMIIVFLAFVFYPSEELAKSGKIKNYENTLAERANLMSTYLEHAEVSSLLFYNETEIYKTSVALARGELSDYEKLNAQSTMGTFAHELCYSDSSITRVSLRVAGYNKSAVRGSNAYERKYNKYVFTNDTDFALREQNGAVAYFPIPEADAAQYLSPSEQKSLRMIRLGRILQDYMKLKELGAIIIDLDVSNCFMGVDSWENGECMLMTTAEGDLLTGDSPISNGILKDITQMKSGTEVSIDGEDYYLLKNNVGKTDFRLIYLISTKVLTEDIREVRNKTMLIVAITFAIVLLITILYSKHLSDRIAKILAGIERYKKGELEFKIEDKSRDELSEIASEFNEMGDDIRELMQNNILIEKKRQEVEKEVLRNQINPHFLFNSLEGIQMYSVIKGQRDISDMVAILGRLLRIGLSEGEEIIELDTELRFIELYLKMIKIRYEDRLEYEITADEKVRSKKMLKLILQPIVENAVKHGFESQDKYGFISIAARAGEDRIYVTITDNGSGIQKDRLAEVQSWLTGNPDPKARIGIKNVYDRIKLLYKGEGTISIESEYGHGTKVKIELPYISEG